MSDSTPPSGSPFPPIPQDPSGQGWPPQGQGAPGQPAAGWGQSPQGPGGPGQFPQGQFPQGQPPPGQYTQGGYPAGQFGPPPKKRKPVVLFIVLGVFALGGIVAALQAAGLIDGTAAVDELDVGDCVMVPEDMDEVSSLTFTNCDNPHDGEVFFLATVPGDDDAAYPFLSLEETAVDECLGAFPDYTGSEFAGSGLDIVFLHPTLGSWGEGDRGITCIITALDGSSLTGTQAG